MRKSIVIALSLLVTGAFAHAQMKPVQPSQAKSPFVVNGAQQAQTGSFPRINQENAYKLFKEGKAVFVDVRSNGQYQAGHIKGAKSIPGSQLLGRFNEIQPGKTVITYCACKAEESSGHAASTLVSHGVKNVWALKGGWNDWKAAGYPTETGAK